MNQRKANLFKLLGYKPYSPSQTAFHDACDTHRFVSWFAGARGGKSKAASKEGTYNLILPNKRIWIAAPTYDLGSKEFSYIWEDITQTLPRAFPGFPKPEVQIFNTDRGRMEIRMPSPINSQILVKSCEDPKALLGEEVDLLILAEGSQIPAVAWTRYLSYRITSRTAKVIIPTTPAGMTWVYDIFYERALAGDKGYWTQNSAAFESPYYPPEERKRHEKEDTKEDFEEQVLGLFVQRSGKVISELKSANILSLAEAKVKWGWDSFEPPINWRRVVSMDYGEAKPKATVFHAIHPRNLFSVAYAEYYQAGASIEEQVQYAKTTLGSLAESRNVLWIVDKSAPILEYHKAGAPVIPSRSLPGQKKLLQATANALLRSLKTFILEDCLKLLWELDRYIFKQDSTQTDADGKDKVRKKDDHGVDAWLYGLAVIADDLMSPIAVSVEEVAEFPMPSIKDELKYDMMKKAHRKQIDSWLFAGLDEWGQTE